MLDESSLRINLSYVLHAPSDSRSVSRAVRASRRFAKDRTTFLRMFGDLSHTDLRSSVHVPPALVSALQRPSSGLIIVAPSVGLRNLLPRALAAVIGRDLTSLSMSFVDIDGNVSPSECMYVQLFRGTASVAVVPHAELDTALFALALVVRPASSSLQLVGEHVHDPVHTSEGGDRRWSNATLRAIEYIIRDHADQWTPERPLWDQPAEQALTEYVMSDTSRDR